MSGQKQHNIRFIFYYRFLIILPISELPIIWGKLARVIYKRNGYRGADFMGYPE